MAERTNGGVFNDQILTGSLRHFIIETGDFSGAVDQYGQPVHGSAAEIIYTTISQRATIVIMNPDTDSISFALETNRSSWTDEAIQVALRLLGDDVGVDGVDLRNIRVTEVPYDFNSFDVGSKTFIELIDTPATYVGQGGLHLAVADDESGVVFIPGGGEVPEFDTPFIPIGASATLELNKKYIATANNMTLQLPGGASQGDTVVVAKEATVTSVLIVGSLLETDLGSDTGLLLDMTEDIDFVWSGSAWHVLFGGLLRVTPTVMGIN